MIDCPAKRSRPCQNSQSEHGILPPFIAKRYKQDAPVSEPEVRAFSGSLGAAKASKGVFVTTSYFTRPACEFAERHPFKMVLIDGSQLAALMIRNNVGVRTAETLHVKKVDEDFFDSD